MAVQNLYPNMSADVGDAQQTNLVKIVAWLKELATGGIVGSSGTSQASSAGTAAKSLVAKSTSGNLVTASVYNKSGGALFFQLFDAAALPANGTVPLIVRGVAANAIAEFDFTTAGLPFTNGMVLALSSTDSTLTLTGTNDGLFLATFR